MKRLIGTFATSLATLFLASSALAVPVDYRIDIVGLGISGTGLVVADSDDFPGVILEAMIVDFQVNIDASILGTDDSASFDLNDGAVELASDPFAVTGIDAVLATLTDTLGIPINLEMDVDGSLFATLGLSKVFGRYTLTEEQPIPEPSTALGLATFALVGSAFVRWRRAGQAQRSLNAPSPT